MPISIGGMKLPELTPSAPPTDSRSIARGHLSRRDTQGKTHAPLQSCSTPTFHEIGLHSLVRFETPFHLHHGETVS
jgi:hypothetical protein